MPHPLTILRTRAKWLRDAAYHLPAPLVRSLKRLARPPDGHASATFRDGDLAGRMSASSLNGRVGNALRDAVTVQLIGQCGPRPVRVLDVGCGLCTTADALADHGLRRYVGVDLSAFAIEQAQREHLQWRAAHHCTMRFHHADLRDFSPDRHDGGPFDVIVFNEALKHLAPDEAAAQATRYAGLLAHTGVICVALTDDAKSRAVLRALDRSLTWIHGALFQQCPDGPRHRVRESRVVPPFLVSLWANDHG